MNQYLLFDLDGTLTDPKVGITTCVQYALHSLGIEEKELDRLEPFIGPPLKDSFMEFYHLDENEAMKAIEKYRERFQTIGLFENKVYKGIKDLLIQCKMRGAKLAVASSKPEIFVKRILKHFGLFSYFDVVVGSELDGTRIAKEEVVKEALHQLFPNGKVDYDNTVMIGDRRFDIEGAKDNKIVSVAVSYGYGDMQELMQAKPDYIARSVVELKKILLRGRKKREEKAFVSWHRATIFRKLEKILLPLAAYIIGFDVLRVIFSMILNAMLSILPDSVLAFDQNGKLLGLAGNSAAIFNSLLFFIMFLIFYSGIGRSDLIQERFCFSIRNTTEEGRLEIKKKIWPKVFLLCCLGVLAVTLAMGINLLFGLSEWIDLSKDFKQVAERQMSAGIVPGLILYGLISPMTEELIFRGILFARLKRYFSAVLSGFLSALFFGLYHGNMIQASYGFIAGCLFAFVYHNTGNFKWTVLIHGLLNVSGFLYSYFEVYRSFLYQWKVCWGALIVAALFFVVVCILLDSKGKRYDIQ